MVVYELRFKDGKIERVDANTALTNAQVNALENGSAKLVQVTSIGEEIVLADIEEITEDLTGTEQRS